MQNCKIKILLSLIVVLLFTKLEAQSTAQKPIRLVVAGASHGHISFILGRKGKTDFEVVGIFEPNSELANRLCKDYGFDPKIIYSNLANMLDIVKPEAAVAFGPIFEHLAVVEACAPRGIHVMVEKPLATTVKQATRMAELANQYNIQLLTDYETSWYPSTLKSYQLLNDSNFVGSLRKVVIHDGHEGPVEIGTNKEFLAWLTDPVLNGGGALIDFGCYGANLMTYLTQGQMPISVTAVTKSFKPKLYSKVEDEATIIVTYPNSQCIIQASWNWPFSRKDMEIYGETGYIVTVNNKTMRLRSKDMPVEKTVVVKAKDVGAYQDPFNYFADAINGKLKMTTYDPYSLANNVMVVKILSAARESAKKGRSVKIQQ
jgi:predicted dehydrogenase